MKEEFQYKFYVKDWDLFHSEHQYGVAIDTTSNGRITITFDLEKNEVNAKGESIDYLYFWDGIDVLYHELPESEDCVKDPYIYIDFENYNGIMVASSIREIAWELDNMYRRDCEYDDDFDPDEWDEE